MPDSSVPFRSGSPHVPDEVSGGSCSCGPSCDCSNSEDEDIFTKQRAIDLIDFLLRKLLISITDQERAAVIELLTTVTEADFANPSRVLNETAIIAYRLSGYANGGGISTPSGALSSSDSDEIGTDPTYVTTVLMQPHGPGAPAGAADFPAQEEFPTSHGNWMHYWDHNLDCDWFKGSNGKYTCIPRAGCTLEWEVCKGEDYSMKLLQAPKDKDGRIVIHGPCDCDEVPLVPTPQPVRPSPEPRYVPPSMRFEHKLNGRFRPPSSPAPPIAPRIPPVQHVTLGTRILGFLKVIANMPLLIMVMPIEPPQERHVSPIA